MTEYTFRSPDTATAMDRVQRELGDDAYILSIQNVEGMVEIKAVKEPIYVANGFRRNHPPKYKKSGLPADTAETGFVFEDTSTPNAAETDINETTSFYNSHGEQVVLPAEVRFDQPINAVVSEVERAAIGKPRDSDAPDEKADNAVTASNLSAVPVLPIEADAFRLSEPVGMSFFDLPKTDQFASWGYNGYLGDIKPMETAIEANETGKASAEQVLAMGTDKSIDSELIVDQSAAAETALEMAEGANKATQAGHNAEDRTADAATEKDAAVATLGARQNVSEADGKDNTTNEFSSVSGQPTEILEALVADDDSVEITEQAVTALEADADVPAKADADVPAKAEADVPAKEDDTTAAEDKASPTHETDDRIRSEAELLEAFKFEAEGSSEIDELRQTSAAVLAPNEGSAMQPLSIERAELLASRGFTDNFIAALPLDRSLNSNNECLDQAVRRLAKGLVPPLFSNDLLLTPQLAIIGPPGSGKTTLAAKLACERFTRTSNLSMMMSLRAPGSLNDTKLRDLARMMNMPHTEIRNSVPTLPDNHAPFIVDIDNIGYKNTISRLSELNEMSPGDPMQVVLTLPSTWCQNALMMLVDTYSHLNPLLVMTQMDIGGVGIEEFCNLYDRGVYLSLLSGTNAVVNTIKASHEDLLYQYLSDLTEFEN